MLKPDIKQSLNRQKSVAVFITRKFVDNLPLKYVTGENRSEKELLKEKQVEGSIDKTKDR